MPGVVGAGPDPDHAGRGDRALQVVVLEQAVEPVADRHREDADELLDVALGHPRDPARLLEDPGDVGGRLRAERRGLADHHRPDEVGGHEQQLLELAVVDRVLLAEAGDRLLGLDDVVVEDDRAVGGHRRVGGVERVGLVAVAASARGRRRPSAAASRRRRSSARPGRPARPPRSRRRRRGWGAARGSASAARTWPGRRRWSARCGRRRRRSRPRSRPRSPAHGYRFRRSRWARTTVTRLSSPSRQTNTSFN